MPIKKLNDYEWGVGRKIINQEPSKKATLTSEMAQLQTEAKNIKPGYKENLFWKVGGGIQKVGEKLDLITPYQEKSITGVTTKQFLQEVPRTVLGIFGGFGKQILKVAVSPVTKGIKEIKKILPVAKYYPESLAETVAPVLKVIKEEAPQEIAGAFEQKKVTGWQRLSSPKALITGKQSYFEQELPKAVGKTAQDTARFLFGLPIEWGLQLIGKKEVNIPLLGKYQQHGLVVEEQQKESLATAKELGIKGKVPTALFTILQPLITQDIFRVLSTAGIAIKAGKFAGKTLNYQLVAETTIPDTSIVQPKTSKTEQAIFGKEQLKSYDLPITDNKGATGLAEVTQVGPDVRVKLYAPRSLDFTSQGIDIAKQAMNIISPTVGGTTLKASQAIEQGLKYSPEGKILSQEYVAKAIFDAQKQLFAPESKANITNPEARLIVGQSLENISSGTYKNLAELTNAIDKALPQGIPIETRNLVIRQALGQTPAFLSDPAMQSTAAEKVFTKTPGISQQTPVLSLADINPAEISTLSKGVANNPYLKAMLDGANANSDAFRVIKTDTGKTVGIVNIDISGKGGYIGNIHILPEYQNQGFGTETIRALFDSNPNLMGISGDSTAQAEGFWTDIGAKLKRNINPKEYAGLGEFTLTRESFEATATANKLLLPQSLTLQTLLAKSQAGFKVDSLMSVFGLAGAMNKNIIENITKGKPMVEEPKTAVATNTEKEIARTNLGVQNGEDILTAFLDKSQQLSDANDQPGLDTLARSFSVLSGIETKAPTLTVAPQKETTAIELPSISVKATDFMANPVVGTLLGQKFWSDSALLELTDQPGVASVLKKMGTVEEARNAGVVKDLEDNIKNLKDEVGIISQYNNNAGSFYRLVLPKGQKIDVKKSYLDYFRKQYENITLKSGVSKGETPTPVIVYSNNKPVGMIMPIKGEVSKITEGQVTTYKEPVKVIAGAGGKVKKPVVTEKVPEKKIKQPSLANEKILQTSVKEGKITPTEFIKEFVKRHPELKETTPVFTYDGKMFIPEGIKETKLTPTALGFSEEEIKMLKKGDQVRYIDGKLEILGKEKEVVAEMKTTVPETLKEEPLAFIPHNLDNPDSPIAEKEVTKLIKQRDIAKELSDKLGVPIRRGKFQHPGAIGIFKPGPKVVRIKSGGLPTIFHEVGHFLDSNFHISDAIDITERESLMAEYGYKYEGQPKRQRSEAFAEFLRYRMTGQKEKADNFAPKFTKIFDQKMNELPEIQDVLNTAAADYQRWQEQPATAKILSQLSIGEKKESARITDKLHTFYTQIKDELHPLSQFSTLAKKLGVSVPVEKDPYILARMLRGWVGKADTFLNKGTFGKQYWEVVGGKVKPVFTGPGLTQILKPIEKAGALNDFRIYLTAQRTIELAQRKIPTGIPLKDATAAAQELNAKYPNFSDTATAVYKYEDSLLIYASEHGLVGEEGLIKIRQANQYRVPFYRVMEEISGRLTGGKKITGNISTPIKKIKGSERPIIDPLENIVKDTYAIINAAERNEIGVAMANLSTQHFELGRLFEEVSKPMRPVTVNAVEVMKKALGTLPGFDINMIPEEISDSIVTLFRPMEDRGANMLNINFGDTSKVFQVDPDLFKALQGLNTENLGMVMRVLALPARLLRAGATLSPDFSIRNPLRDQFTAFTYSRYRFIPGIDLIRGMFHLFTKDDVYNLFKMSGAEHTMMVSMDREYLQKNLKEILKSKGATALQYIKHPLEVLRLISEFGEKGTRLGEMAKGLDTLANPIETGFASREVTLDFVRIGAKTKAINAIVAFWNANVEGLDKMARAFKDKPYRTLFKVLMGITLPSILLYLANRKDKRWKEIPAWQKDLFWIILTPKHIWRIPKPFELGIIFGSIPERILEYMDNHDKNILNELERSIVNGATPSYIPTFLAPLIENASNYSFFLNRRVVPAGKENLPKEAQYGTYTSEISKIAGSILNYSPAKIDNLVTGYSGGLGKYATSTLDSVMSKLGITHKPVSPAMATEDWPVIKSFMIRPPTGQYSESVNRVYELYNKTTGDVQYAKKLNDSKEMGKLYDFVTKNPNVAYASLLNNTIRDFADINNARDEIRKSTNLSAQDKKSAMNALDNLETEIAQKVLEQIK